MFVDKGHGIFNDAGGDIDRVLRVPPHQEFGENIDNVVVQKGFLDGDSVFELQVDFVQVFFKAVIVLQRDDGIPVLHNGLEVASGSRTVEMQPLRVPAGAGVVAVRPVTVQHHHLIGRGVVMAPVDLHLAAALAHVHDQKTVVRVPPEAISRAVTEVPHVDRVEKQAFSLGAWRVNIVVGTRNYAAFG